MPAKNKRTKKKGGGKKSSRKKSRFRTSTLIGEGQDQRKDQRQGRAALAVGQGQGARSGSRPWTGPSPETGPSQIPIKLDGFQSYSLSSEPREGSFDIGLLERHGDILFGSSRRQIPEDLFQEVPREPNIEGNHNLEKEYKDIRGELDRLKQAVYIDHQYQLKLIMEQLEMIRRRLK